MRIGELSRATGVSTRALRYYEEQGLLVGERLANGYRDYPAEAVETVRFIQDLYSAGLPSDVVRDVLPCAQGERPTGDCAALLARAEQVRQALREQEERIAQRRRTLEQFLEAGSVIPPRR
ncbi:MerR family transcriptional regulator [Pseudonocardia sp. WMMC193]|uniref:MerR family transcriptional regulator n=1 Tax=Pseudonocardia sp. WMMC193 TaxID=2911965 RepID=UPI001F32865A|nr:MerR family transcriptional regulator [Pseudonocardia sp. WMMC193]MCF7551196.1 MerR family transcriptional regulator [Pseudonocardia sp. WMMC193]